MPRFVIEVSQPSGALSRRRIDDAVQAKGSHFASHADWRLEGSRYTGTMIVEADDMSEIANIVPLSMRPYARLYRLELAEAA
jgi:hypothetical protein